MNAVVSPIHQETAPDLRMQLRGMMDSNRTLSQASIAKQVGVSPTVISQYLNGTYPGAVPLVEEKIQRWIDNQAVARQHADAMPEAPSYIDTPTSTRVITSLRYAQVAGDVAVIYGGAGLGKTSAIRRYASTAPNVFHATMTPAHSGVVTALSEIARAVGTVVTSGGAAKMHDAILRKVRDTNGLLVVDEAQHLSTTALDQIRSIHDDTGIGLAFVGNEGLYARMTGGNRAAELDRLYSRVGKKMRLVKASQADIDALLDAWNVRDARSRQMLVDIATKPGALRILTKVLRLASMYAAAEGTPVGYNEIRMAWRELGGAE